jgi:hypothetical protein
MHLGVGIRVGGINRMDDGTKSMVNGYVHGRTKTGGFCCLVAPLDMSHGSQCRRKINCLINPRVHWSMMPKALDP